MEIVLTVIGIILLSIGFSIDSLWGLGFCLAGGFIIGWALGMARNGNPNR